MPHDDRTLARAGSFGSVAEAYERVRPGYPAQLFIDLGDYAGAAVDHGVLEIGAGTGKATMSLVRAGWEVLALEPSAQMATVLRQRLDEAGMTERVRIRVAGFEALDDSERFGLVVAAQSFHWIDPDTRWQRLARALIPNGAAGLFWNDWLIDPAVHDHDAVRRVFAGAKTELTTDLEPLQTDDAPPDGLGSAPDLTDYQVRLYPWSWTLTTDDYLGLLATTSQFVVLTEPERRQTLDALGAALGDQTHLLAQTSLSLLRRSA